jgi:hypothetical protein
MRKVSVWGVVVLVVAAAVTACTSTSSTTATDPSAGTSSTTSIATPTTADKAGFLAQGNAICKAMDDRSLALTQQYQQGPKTRADLQQMLDGNGDLIELSVVQLKALPQPAGDEAQLSAMYADVERLASLSHQLATATGQGNRDLMSQLQTDGSQLQSATNAEANAYGLTECGKGS